MKIRRWMPAALLALFALTATPGSSSAQRLGSPIPTGKAPTEATSVVPTDAMAFGHVKLAELWKSDSMKEFRDIILKAGDKAIAAFDARFVPTPSSMDTVTFFVLNAGKETYPYVVFTLSKPLDKPEFIRSLGKTKEVNAAKSSMVTLEGADTAFWFIDASTFGVSSPDAIQYLMTRKAPSPVEGYLNPAVILMDKPIAFGMQGKVFENLEKELPPAFQPLVRMKGLIITADTVGNGHIDIRMSYESERARLAAENSIDQLKDVARQGLAEARKMLTAQAFGDGKIAPIEQMAPAAMALVGLGLTQYAEELLKDLPIKKEKNDLVLNVALPKGGPLLVAGAGVSAGLALPAIQKVREAASRTQDQNNLKQMALAMHNYESTYGFLAPSAICDKKGKPLLSWRVAVLPYIEQENLYKQFKLDEPWDSETNKPLIAKMPAIYAVPYEGMQKPGMTHYRVFTGAQGMFHPTERRTLIGISDGTSNTIMIAEFADAVEWTKPEDFVYDAKKPLPKMLQTASGGFNVAMGDGSVRFVRTTISETALRAAITANGGEVFNFDK